MTARRVVPIAGLLVLALTGCAGGAMTTPASGSRPPLRTAPAAPPTTSATVPAVRWAAIEEDLRQRGVDAAPTLVLAEAVTWPNGALGCPRPGVMYTQALEDGMRVLVAAGDREYDYRFGRTGAPLLCEHGSPVPGRP